MILNDFSFVVRFTLEMFRLYKNVFTCFVKYEREQLGDIAIIVVFLELPKYFCLLLLIVKFIVIMVRTLKDRAEKKKKGLVCCIPMSFSRKNQFLESIASLRQNQKKQSQLKIKLKLCKQNQCLGQSHRSCTQLQLKSHNFCDFKNYN